MPETRKCPSCGLELSGEDLSVQCPYCVSSGGADAAAPADQIGRVGTIVVPLPATEKPGDRIGRFKLLQEIGEGTFGIVYMAEQEEPVRRRVALKILKLGMDTKEVITRFEAERQALAMMDHPNIAKVLDAGATVSGRPYFVMELVKGERITEYCDKNSLPTRERLDLFIKVCHAIQHAHQKGIIHRDIKPSNILVTLHDGVPVPKVIDFGIAKATQGKLTNRTLFTAYDQFIGTPAYMSPEQAEMSGLDIDTRSDIYSLGVVLYELLAGRTPFDAREIMASGLDAIRKTIREHDPVRPSTRVATLSGEELTSMAKDRSTDTARLMSQLKGDLDWIVMKCLEKDRTRRYATASELAMDINRHLHNEPVVARPPSQVYRLQKAFRRHKLVLGAVAAVATALVLGVIGTTLGLLRAENLRQKAEEAGLEESKQKGIALRSLKAEQEQHALAEAEELAARRTAYNSDMNLAQQALAANNLGSAQRLLDRQRNPGQTDLRNWEWRYLWGQTRGDDHEVLLSGTNRILHPLSFSADGWLLAWQAGGETVVMDLISRRTVLRRPNARRPVFTHHGARLAFVEGSPIETITILDMNTQKESRIKTSWGITRWMGFTPDDRRLLTVSSSPNAQAQIGLPYEVTEWDLETGLPRWERGLKAPSTENGRPYAISPDGTAFAAVVPNGRVEVWQTQDGSPRCNIQATEEESIAVRFSPDSSILLTGAGYTDSAIRLWDARDGKPAGSLEGHRSWVSDLLFTADGKRLISSSGDQTIRLWDWATLKPAGVLRGHLDEVDGLAAAPDGRSLVSRCKDGSIYLWDLNKPARNLGYRTLPCPVQTTKATFTADSQSIRAVDFKGSVGLWDASTLKETRRLWSDPTNGGETFVSPDNRWILRHQADGRLLIWDARDGKLSTNQMTFKGDFQGSFTVDGKLFLTLTGPSTKASLEAWDTETWQRKGLLTTDANEFFVTELPNSFVIMTFQALRLFDATKLDQPPKQFESRGDVLGLDVSPDGRLLAAAYEDGFVRVWDMTTLQPLETLKGLLLAPTSVTFSPDGRRLAVGSSGSEAVKLWDTETWQEVLTLSGEGSGFETVRFSPDGRYLMGVNEAGLAHLWFAPSWAEIEAAETSQQTQARR